MTAESPARAVVTGASRGLGLEFVRQLLEAGHAVVAGCRRPERAGELQALSRAFPGRLHILALDVADAGSRAAFAAAVAGQHAGIELLVNNAGVLHAGERFGALDQGVLADSFATNAIGPLLLTEALAPLLAQGRRSATEHARVLNLSSVMGSLTGARDLHSPSYRISKAALNMAGVMMARALNPRGVGVLTVHPGWVRTDMGGASAPLAPAAAVRALLDLVERCPGLPAGEFRDPEGQLIPW